MLFWVQRGDELLVVTNPDIFDSDDALCAWKKKINYTILVHDIFPENLVAIKKMSSSSIAYKCLKRVYDKVILKLVFAFNRTRYD